MASRAILLVGRKYSSHGSKLIFTLTLMKLSNRTKTDKTMKKILKQIVLAGVCLSACFAVPSLAENVNFKHKVPFQGRLFDDHNDIVEDDVYDLTFRLYEEASTGKAIWSETHPKVSVINGYVSVILGALVDMNYGDQANYAPLNFSTEQPYYVSVAIDGGTELFPRQQLIPSFHATTAGKAHQAQFLINEISGETVGHQDVKNLITFKQDNFMRYQDDQGIYSYGPRTFGGKPASDYLLLENYELDSETLTAANSSATAAETSASTSASNASAAETSATASATSASTAASNASAAATSASTALNARVHNFRINADGTVSGTKPSQLTVGKTGISGFTNLKYTISWNDDKALYPFIVAYKESDNEECRKTFVKFANKKIEVRCGVWDNEDDEYNYVDSYLHVILQYYPEKS